VAFSDPQTVTINAIDNTLPRTGSGMDSGVFSKDDGSVVLSVRHRYGRRTRRELRLQHSKVAPDPLISAQNIKHSLTIYFAIDTPVTGYTVTEAKQIGDALVAYLTASSGANLTKLLGGES
jgi:hypothetical protein